MPGSGNNGTVRTLVSLVAAALARRRVPGAAAAASDRCTVTMSARVG